MNDVASGVVCSLEVAGEEENREYDDMILDQTQVQL